MENGYVPLSCATATLSDDTTRTITNGVWALNLIASQARDVATAQLFLGSLLGNVDGTVQLNGEWPASGTIRSGEVSIETVWVFQSAQSGRITGSGNFLIRADGVSGELRMEVEMVNLVRGGATDLAGRAGNDRPVRTIRDLKAALLRRR